MSTNQPPVKDVIEAALLSAGEPLNLDRLQRLFSDDERPEADEIRGILDALRSEWEGRPLELKQVGSGFRFQVRNELSPWLNRLNDERAPRYSRALLETLALIVYRQPITRAGIEEIRGVSVSSQIIRTLLEREWIRVVGHRDVPGKPALFGTTKKFLDYFNLKSLSELPPLAEIQPLDHLQEEFLFSEQQSAGPAGDAGEDETGEIGEVSSAQGGGEKPSGRETSHDYVTSREQRDRDDEEQRHESKEPAPALH